MLPSLAHKIQVTNILTVYMLPQQTTTTHSKQVVTSSVVIGSAARKQTAANGSLQFYFISFISYSLQSTISSPLAGWSV